MRLLRRLNRLLQRPPAWRWLCHGKLWQRVGPAPLALWQLPLELLQQLHWWLVVPLRKGNHRSSLILDLPLDLRLKACWLNSYQSRELAWWWTAGVRNWKELSRYYPESMVGQLHRERRQKWPSQCRPALELLSDKSALLALTPPAWQPAFLTLQPRTPTETEPNWWWTSLEHEGLVLKPLQGHAGRDVVRFQWRRKSLSQKVYSNNCPKQQQSGRPHIGRIQGFAHHWQQITGCCEPALASPYIENSPLLPASNPSVVVRVITAQAAPEESISMLHAWLEVPLSGGVVICLSTDGVVLPNPDKSLTIQQSKEVQKWKELLSSCKKEKIQACLNAAIAMHTLLPPIDQVAWDWIPTEPTPQLLEGNGSFGLMEAQLFQKLQESTNINPS